eukprot:CAMPEP_0195527012 /NCGR_PEP_ID=MMETSP0794_2-20130614/28419_1 /TAXON_ID=515487 /ORGANISM="Stephanopyxis turris, Strain CCMP 815" /LENGTH=78 /DNA_ID=CAMNT_0040657833 /DNA_START=154 /DNA_END=390 /DNA_ORIENTATION=-
MAWDKTVARKRSAAMEVMVDTCESMKPTPCLWRIRRESEGGTVVARGDKFETHSFLLEVAVVVVEVEEAVGIWKLALV